MTSNKTKLSCTKSNGSWNYCWAIEAVKDLKFLDMSLTEINLFYFATIQLLSFLLKTKQTTSEIAISIYSIILWDWYNQNLFDIKDIMSKENYADILTKTLVKDSFLRFKEFFLWRRTLKREKKNNSHIWFC